MTAPKHVELPLTWSNTVRLVLDLLIPGRFRDYADYQEMDAREQQVLGWALVGLRVLVGFILGLIIATIVPVLLKGVVSALISLVVVLIIPLVVITGIYLGLRIAMRAKK
jgi:hypothetical protein